jgi:hypothetical protein
MLEQGQSSESLDGVPPQRHHNGVLSHCRVGHPQIERCANHSLLSVGQLYDEGYIVTFKQAEVTICDSGNSQILSGPRDLNTGLWRINLKQTNNHKPEPIANSLYELRNTGALVHYLHKALFGPTKSAM